MTDAVTRAAEVLKEHRASIDRLDAILVYTLGERFAHTQAVGKLKAAHDLPPSDPAREEAQIARLTDLANRADLDPEFASDPTPQNTSIRISYPKGNFTHGYENSSRPRRL